MQPQEQNPPPAPPPMAPANKSPQDQYDFIMNPDESSKKRILPLPGGDSKKGRIIVVGVAAVILIILTTMVAGFISNAGKENVESLVEAAKQQQELLRVSDIGVEKARTQEAKNIAITTKLSIESQKSAMLAAIKSQNRKLSAKELAGGNNAKTTQLLTEAEQANRFDEVFLDVMKTNLTTYQKTVKKAYDSASSKKLRDALTEQYKSANALAGIAQEAGS